MLLLHYTQALCEQLEQFGGLIKHPQSNGVQFQNSSLPHSKSHLYLPEEELEQKQRQGMKKRHGDFTQTP